MRRSISFRLDELFGSSDPGCGFLDEEELELWADGRLEVERLEAFLRHAATCSDCTELQEDLAAFDVADRLRGNSFRGTTPAAPTGVSPARARRARARRRLRWAVPAGVAAAAAAALFLLLPPAPLIEGPLELPFVPPPAVRGEAGDAWAAAGEAWRDGAPAVAAASLERLVEDRPDDADAWYHLGVARLAAGDAGAAVEALDRAETLQRELPSETTHWARARALDRDGRREEACAALRDVVALDGARAGRARQALKDGCPDVR